MAGISPKLPLTRNNQDGYALNKTVLESVKQNVKMVVLTSPGERVMDPEFGVGIRRFLFENANTNTYGELRSRIANQIARYLPFVNILDIDIEPEQQGASSAVAIKVELRYTVSSLSDVNILAISVSETT
tara:strand:- start:329 stop:718 length:390 start_codon:yes stop_codon:yes gene_type:complete